MSKPITAVIGRPNVGKSTLFNALAGQMISIVEDTPGVTRDRIYADCTWLDHSFTLIDTGGIEPKSDDLMLKSMREQAEIAIETADVIIFMTDAKEGLVDADYEVADMLRKAQKPVVLAVNKIDNFKAQQNDIYEFYNLGIGDPYPICASQKTGLGDLLDEVVKHFPEGSGKEEEDDRPRIAVIGKPNVGKSSLINKLTGENRVIVTDIAGTTRDSIDTDIKHNGKEYIFIDTAGLRRKSRIKEDIERYSIIRAVAAVERADVVILMIDAAEGITEQDAKIAGIAHERGKGMIIAVNKWDLIIKDNKTVNEYSAKIRSRLPFMSYAEIIYISAQTGQRLPRLFDIIDAVIENHAMRVGTGALNEILMEAVAMKQPPSDKGRRLKLYYITQVSVKPPTFVIFINDKKLTHFSYTRYIENCIRGTFGFRGTPLNFIYRERKGAEE
ncbi:MAG: ribosome biogenesis GTPase Der [Lachnospiraceae bacterium]|nr:ribosome biogenesis GTPase Der [Lachnospiraceae bacterium]